MSRIPAARWIAAIVMAIPFFLSRPPSLSAQKVGWHNRVEAGGSLFFGAAHGRVLSLSAGTNHADSVINLHIDGQFTYADSRNDDGPREVTARSAQSSFGIDYQPFARFNPFGFGTIETSFQQRIAYRFSGGLGAKFTFQRQAKDDFSLSLGLLWERTEALDPEPDVDPTSSLTRWSLQLRFLHHLTRTLRLVHASFYQPAVDHLASYTASFDTALEAALTAKLAATVTLRSHYDTEAEDRGANSNLDGQFLFGLKAVL
jgi:hypothetical protein